MGLSHLFPTLIIAFFSVLVDSPFLILVSQEGCLEQDTGLALDAWLIFLQHCLEPLFGSAGFTASGRE